MVKCRYLLFGYPHSLTAGCSHFQLFFMGDLLADIMNKSCKISFFLICTVFFGKSFGSLSNVKAVGVSFFRKPYFQYIFYFTY